MAIETLEVLPLCWLKPELVVSTETGVLGADFPNALPHAKAVYQKDPDSMSVQDYLTENRPLADPLVRIFIQKFKKLLFFEFYSRYFISRSFCI